MSEVSAADVTPTISWTAAQTPKTKNNEGNPYLTLLDTIVRDPSDSPLLLSGPLEDTFTHNSFASISIAMNLA